MSLYSARGEVQHVAVDRTLHHRREARERTGRGTVSGRRKPKHGLDASVRPRSVVVLKRVDLNTDDLSGGEGGARLRVAAPGEEQGGWEREDERKGKERVHKGLGLDTASTVRPRGRVRDLWGGNGCAAVLEGEKLYWTARTMPAAKNTSPRQTTRTAISKAAMPIAKSPIRARTQTATVYFFEMVTAAS